MEVIDTFFFGEILISHDDRSEIFQAAHPIHLDFQV